MSDTEDRLRNTQIANIAQQLTIIAGKFPDWVSVPVSASASGIAGQVAYDTGFLYVCVSPSTWKRVALSTF